MAQHLPEAASARPDRARLEPGDITPGEPLPLDVFDRSGRKLLGRGQVVRGLAQLERLLEIGLWGEADAVQALRGGRGGPGPAPGAPVQFQSLCAFAELRALRADLDRLLSGWTGGSAPEAVASVRAMAARLMHAVELDPDAAVATLAWLRDRPHGARQAVNAAVLTDLMLAMDGAPATLRCSATCAALTMNLSIHSLQDVLYEVKTPTAAQQAEILAHPARSAALLAEAGVDDAQWLEAVRQHHEAADGSGYPARLAGTATCLAARALGVADRFCAVISERAYRPAVPAGVALARMFDGSNATLDAGLSATLVRVMGAWPPGTVVLLHSGELAVVTRRTTDPRGPVARMVRTRDGLPSAACPKRITQRGAFAIVEEAGRERLPAGVAVESLWSDALEAAPA